MLGGAGRPTGAWEVTTAVLCVLAVLASVVRAPLAVLCPFSLPSRAHLQCALQRCSLHFLQFGTTTAGSPFRLCDRLQLAPVL